MLKKKLQTYVGAMALINASIEYSTRSLIKIVHQSYPNTYPEARFVHQIQSIPNAWDTIRIKGSTDFHFIFFYCLSEYIENKFEDNARRVIHKAKQIIEVRDGPLFREVAIGDKEEKYNSNFYHIPFDFRKNYLNILKGYRKISRKIVKDAIVLDYETEICIEIQKQMFSSVGLQEESKNINKLDFSEALKLVREELLNKYIWDNHAVEEHQNRLVGNEIFSRWTR